MQTSPVDSLTEDIDLLIASIGLLSSIVDVKEPSIPPPLNDSKQQQQPPYDKEPPCDVPRGIGEESCPPSPTQHHSLRLNLPQQYSDQETTSPSSSGDSARYPSLLTPQQSLALGDELLSSISSPGGGGGEGGGLSEESFPSRLHIERMLTTRSSQMLPPESATPVDSDEVKPLPSIPQEMSKVEESESKQDSTPPPPPPPPPTVSRAYPKRLDSTDSTTAPESPSIRNLRDFHKMYNSKQFLFGTHSRTRSAPSNNILNNLDLSSTSSSSSDTPRPRVRQGRPAPLDADHVRSMFEILPPVPKSPPPVPMTVEGRTLSRQNSTKALPSQLRYQLSRGSLRRPLPPPPHRLPPLSGLDDRPRPQTEFRVGQAPLSFSSIPARVPYTSPPAQTQFSMHAVTSPLMEREQEDEHSTESAHTGEQHRDHREQEQREREQLRRESIRRASLQFDQYHRTPPSPSIFSQVSMTHSDPDREAKDMLNDDDDDDDYDDDAQSYMSNPLDGMRSPISPDETIFLDGRPRPRRRHEDGSGGDTTPQPTSFFDLGFDMDIGRLQKRSRWKFWSKITKHHKRSK